MLYDVIQSSPVTKPNNKEKGLLNMTFLIIMKAAAAITDAFKLTLSKNKEIRPKIIKVEYKLYINVKHLNISFVVLHYIK